ncbi:helix-turn-helix transcriptional regulator [Steroidobacter sp.]|uniref:helix-turn-helix transcriptional regulator n=1 Tax=Steroidobacter sp. TaxID=1978227 RepID=UPI001A4D6EF6|nr:helix-turn-helix transcriptional regulator [Steroidobacter sp.]MBL8269277.1 helix-turn-helix transcriptional regulator [Steroidobacter sp.]
MLENAAQRDAIELTARFGSALLARLQGPDFLAALAAGLQPFVAYKNFIVFGYREGFSADLIFTNLELPGLSRQMRPYTDGLYLLDPFYIADMSQHRHGLLQLAEVAPDDFEQSEFFLTFYAAVDVLDELHYVVPLSPGRSVHVFIERELPGPKFSAAEVETLTALESIVTTAIRAHWRWRDGVLPQRSTSPIQSAGGIDGVIRNMKPGELTEREVEVIGLSLRGHSAKLIARELGISEATVTNHKRNVYEKLGVHSQSQLFSMFLNTLSSDAPGT